MDESMQPMIIKPGKEKSILRRHPWIFSGTVGKMPDPSVIGGTVPVVDSKGVFLAWAAFNPNSKIVGRIWSWNPQDLIDEEFFEKRLRKAISSRSTLELLMPGFETNAMRLVHAESDGLPGLIIDRYDQVLVFQFLSAGSEFWREYIIRLASEITGCRKLFERSDVDVRRLEGLSERVGVVDGNEFPTDLVIVENGMQFYINVLSGHKTGFYLDQRYNRFLVRNFSKDLEVLDCFCYTGGFTCSVLAGEAHSVISVDSSQDALQVANQNLTINHLDHRKVELRQGDVFSVLREMRDRRQTFDMIILDPPKFAQSASQIEHAARGYKDINLLACKLIRPGGFLVTFSCSGGVNEDLFQKIVAGAALDAGVNARIIHRLSQASDHPVALNFPEGAYLKGFILQIS